jgi:hypothetical protein
MRILLVVLLAASTTAFAAELAEPRQFTFGGLDLDRDYFLSEDEAARSASVARNFDNMDLDRDGRLSPLEFNNLVLALSVEPDPFPVDRR